MQWEWFESSVASWATGPLGHWAQKGNIPREETHGEEILRNCIVQLNDGNHD